MSDFWSRKLGQQTNTQPQARPTAPATIGVRPWWESTPQPQQHAAQPPVGQPVTLQEPENYAPRQAKSARHMKSCPECIVGDYMGDPASPNARWRCFSCGYPYSQTGSSGIQTQAGAPATPARQIHDGSSNYNPGQIIGRIQ